jgi:hypothetical protein
MPKNNLTNQELLKELESRLPEFTLEEVTKLSELVMTNMPSNYKENSLKIIKETSPQLHDSIKETVQQLEKEKIDKQVTQIKKSLLDKK